MHFIILYICNILNIFFAMFIFISSFIEHKITWRKWQNSRYIGVCVKKPKTKTFFFILFNASRRIPPCFNKIKIPRTYQVNLEILNMQCDQAWIKSICGFVNKELWWVQWYHIDCVLIHGILLDHQLIV